MKLNSEVGSMGVISSRFSGWAFWACRLCILALLPMFGCTSPSGSSPEGADGSPAFEDSQNVATQRAPKVSQVPLRIWVVGKMQQSEVLVRQWLADDEQPAEIRVISVEELLASEAAKADVLIYPSRMLGELIVRQWVVKLPQSIVDSKIKDVDLDGEADSDARALLSTFPALVSSSSCDGFQYALPLGFSTISMLGSASTTEEQLSHEALFEKLVASSDAVSDGKLEIPHDSIDSDALVDRFLSIAIGRTPVNTKYGVLFDVRGMQPRLSQPEFVFAAELLIRLARQPGAMRSVVGSHSEAWHWASQAESEAYALVSATELDTASRTLDQGRWIRLLDAKSWNTGAGMLASITAQCRQSAQSVRFIEWLSRARTIASIESNLLGTVSLSNATSHLADRVNQHALTLLSNYNVSCEPRLPMANEYRRALAAELVTILSGEASVVEGLAKAAASWEKITGENTKAQQREYERSLGMTL